MSIFGLRSGSAVEGAISIFSSGLVSYGQSKADGSHDHRYNRGNDRTPAQKHGDTKRTKK